MALALRVGVATLLAMAGLVALPQALTPQAEAADVTNVTGAVGTIQGVSGTTITCARYSPGAGTFTTAEARAAYGRTGSNCPNALDLSQQSGVGFQVNSPGTVADNTPFLLSRIVHYNRPINGLTAPTGSNSSYIGGSLSVRLGSFQGTPTITYPWVLEETTNTAGLCPSWQQTGTPCDDRVTFTDQAGTQSVVDAAGRRYRLTITNIQKISGSTCPVTPGAGTTTNQFITEENKETTGCVYAQLKPVRNVTIKKLTVPAGASQSFPFTAAGQDINGNALPGFSLIHNGTTTQEIATSATYTENAVSRWNLTGLTCDQTESVTTNLAARSVTIGPVGPDVTCTYTNTQVPWQDLVVTKTANPTFDRDYDWTLTKNVDRTRAEVPAGTNATFNYTVTATKGAAQDSNFRVTGVISIRNPNTDPMSGVTVTDALPGGTCTVTNGTGVTIAAGATVTRNYSCTLASRPAGTITNTATATWSATTYPQSTGTASGTAPVTFTDPGTVTDNEVTVTDTNYDLSTLPGGNRISASKTFTYAKQFPGVAGTCTNHPNTATLATDDGRNLTADRSVTVCAGSDLVVTKNVVMSYDRTYAYSLSKDVDATTRTVDPATGQASFHYQVTVTGLPYTDSRWAMSGQITVRNPNDWQDVTADITDTVDVGGGATCTVTGGTGAVIGRGASRTFDYVCTFTSEPSYTGTNTATARWDAAAFHTPNSSASGTAAITSDGWSVRPVNQTVQVVDDQTVPGQSVVLGSFTWSGLGASQTFEYDLALDGEPGACVDYTNTAQVQTTAGGALGDPADATVSVCWPQWTLSKTADPATGSTVQPGSEVTYSVLATNTGESAVEGAEITDDLSDVLNHAQLVDGSISWSADGDQTVLGADPVLTGTTLSGTITSLAPGESVTLTYRVTLDDDAYDVTIRNAVTGGGDFPSEECTEDEPCTTEHETPGRPTLTLRKVVENVNGGNAAATEWTLSADGPTSITGNAGDAAVTDAEVDLGDYTLEESDGPDGYEATNLACEDADGAIDGVDLDAPEVTLAAGDAVTCTFTNTDLPGKLTLVKEVDNTWGGTATPGDFTLTADGPTDVTGTGTVTSEVSAGDYELSESGPAGYERDGDWVCEGGDLSGTTVTVANGADVTCTVTNVDQPATLTLVKEVNNDAGGTAEADDWTLTAAGDEQTVEGTTGVSGDVSAGTYTLSEDGPDGYRWDAIACVDGDGEPIDGVTIATPEVTVDIGDDVTCTFTNGDRVPRLTLIKAVDDTFGGDADPAAWTLTADGPVSISGSTGDDAVTGAAVQRGTYDLSEAGGPDGYELTELVCVDNANSDTPIDGPSVDNPEVTVGLGQSITCQFTNAAQPAKLTLVKEVGNDWGGTATADQWTLTATGADDTVSGATGVSGEVAEGSYDLSEEGPDGYEWDDLTCTGSDAAADVTVENPALDLSIGDDVTCTFANSDLAPRLTLVKTVENDPWGGTADATDWTLTATGSEDTVEGETGADEVTSVPVHVGDYALGEEGPDGYDLSDLTCTGSDGAAAVTVDAPSLNLGLGDQVTCAFTNTAVPGTLTLVKEVQNSWNGPLGPEDFTLTADGPTTGVTGVTGDAEVTSRQVIAGDYDLSETNPDPVGYEQDGDWVCEGGSLDGDTVTVAGGADVTCTVTNVDRPAKLTLVKEVDANESGSTAVPADWTLTAQPQDIEGQDEVAGPGDPSADGGVNAAEVFAGDYVLSEDGPAGFDAGGWVCEGAAVSGDTVTIANGANVTCTITNTAVAPTLTLVKSVDNGNTGADATPQDWTLVADGPSPVSGQSGGDAVTGVNVSVGTYTLSETDGPDGYDASDWVCDTDVTGGNSITLAEGDDVTCTITNTARRSEWEIEKSSDPASGSTVQPGDLITYTVTARQLRGVASRNVVVTDDLSQVQPYGEVVDGSITVTAGTAAVSGTNLVWTIGTLTGERTLTYQVRVNEDAFGVTLKNAVTGAGITPPDECTDDCTTEHPTPSQWTLSKSSDPVTGSQVQPGDTITYTVTARNLTPQGSVAPRDLVVVDDLSDVLNHAVVQGSATASVGSARLSGTELTWQIPELTTRATLTYRVRVAQDAWSVTVRNAVTGAGAVPCVPEVATIAAASSPLAAAVDTSCLSTEHTTPAVDDANVDDNAEDAGVEAGAIADTGSPVGPAAVLAGLVLLGSGATLLVAARRRRTP